MFKKTWFCVTKLPNFFFSSEVGTHYMCIVSSNVYEKLLLYIIPTQSKEEWLLRNPDTASLTKVRPDYGTADVNI
jgi:hypothetical protein